MGDTTIGWTNKTWNPVTGCSHKSDGCRNCYAEALSLRYGWSSKPWTAVNAAENVVLRPERLQAPLHWKKPQMIFVNSMSDLFHEQVPDDYIEKVFSVMALASQHIYQVLTKRPERMMRWCEAHSPVFAGQRPGWDGSVLTPLPNVWLGTSVENQRAADERLPYLRNTRAVIRFLSCEPLLGPIDLLFSGRPIDQRIDWVIAGGESGPHYRPMDLDWARSLRDQCQDAGVAFYYKQGASRFPGRNKQLDGREWQEYPATLGRAVCE
ncbi:MAG: phage Gp37/Gp68 family protein [Ktedonobacteraceae bacterium]|nr:phage Gp37/Gp68 family protein [Ktedonobacteraceae bacterium]